MKHSFERLDIMIAYSCNIACKGCISLSDFSRDGVAPLEDIKQWVDYWKELIAPDVLTIFGGEPCLHPNLIEVCKHIRTAWPTSTIRLITNGYFLHKFDTAAWFELTPLEIQVSIHRKDHEKHINQTIGKILKHRIDWQVTRHGGDHHKQLEWSSAGISVYKSIFKDFIVPYKQNKEEIIAYTSDPAEAHKICGAPSTPILYKGKLYKCPPVANLIDVTGKNFTGYVACSDETTLAKFVDGIGKPESVCSQCPTLQTAKIIDHFNTKNVTVKNKITS